VVNDGVIYILQDPDYKSGLAGLMPRIGYCFCPNAGRAITFLLDEKSNQKNQAKVILPRTCLRRPGLLWLACAGIPIPSGFWGMHCSAMVENGDSAD
jgi:hypothetical protein